MELCPTSTLEMYLTFQNLYIAINLYVSKEGYVITTKPSKKNKKGKLQKL